MTDWPTREEWAEHQRQYPRLPDGCWSTQPRPASADYASAAETKSVIASLKQAWRDLGREVRAAAPRSDAKLEASSKRRDINDVMGHLQKERPSLPIYAGRTLTREELSAMVPLLDQIEARYTTARDAARAAYGQWWESMAVADVSDEAWATELERRREYAERQHRRAEELAAYKADREERERQQREEAIARGVATRAKRREENFREAVQALRDNALRPATRCRCRRKALTDLESIARGIGPECWEYILKAVEHEQAV
ncbi:hypothetical protein GWG65_34965 [Bradyrhizobium sp. CSA207]|uniref:DUF6011 domain-containing protein n=1 Tax=Bradyrhizobium sp. CSA207 TaxID=2698826 RepID=UPI0023B1D0EE|nr:DUF6011 domain-containing protein [Bradyrhizobium sp. CSA207]MDE5446475.1 hypothetical protein [Bradyrhizobium sp. CSA207]